MIQTLRINKSTNGYRGWNKENIEKGKTSEHMSGDLKIILLKKTKLERDHVGCIQWDKDARKKM